MCIDARAREGRLGLMGGLDQVQRLRSTYLRSSAPAARHGSSRGPAKRRDHLADRTPPSRPPSPPNPNTLWMSVARPASIARLAAAVARPHAACRRSSVALPALFVAAARRPFSTSAAMSAPYTVVSTSSAPKAIGPYSQAIKHAGLVYTSGAIGFDPETMDIVSPNAIEAQAEQMVSSSSFDRVGPTPLGRLLMLGRVQPFLQFKNLGEVLKASGSSPAKVVKTTCARLRPPSLGPEPLPG